MKPRANPDQARQRRQRLLEIMRRDGINARQLGDLLERDPHAVRNWRSGCATIPDHTAALIEMAHKAGHLRAMAERTRDPRWAA